MTAQWTILGISDKRTKHGGKMLRVRCTCGKEKDIAAASYKAGRSKCCATCSLRQQAATPAGIQNRLAASQVAKERQAWKIANKCSTAKQAWKKGLIMMHNMRKEKCECGKTLTKNETIPRPDPFQHEIHNKTVLITACDNCSQRDT